MFFEMNDGKLCRLCLKPHDDDFEAIGGCISQILEKLLIKLVNNDLDLNEKLVICKNCLENLQKAIDFKLLCLSTENCIYSSAYGSDSIKVNLKDAYLRKNGNTEAIYFPQDHSICRFCLTLVKYGFFTHLKSKENKMVLAQVMLQSYFSKLNVSITEDPVTCIPCHDSIKDFFNFIKSCMDVEEKIEHCDNQRATSGIEVKIDNVLEYRNEKIMKIEEKPYDDVTAKIDENFAGRDEHILRIKNEEIHIKTEQTDYSSIQEITQGLPVSNAVELGTQKCEMCLCETQTYFGQQFFNYTSSSHVEMHKCKIRADKSKHNIKTHMTTHKQPSKITKHRCGVCGHEAKQKSDLMYHMRSHRSLVGVTVHKCEICEFQSKYKRNLKRHLTNHKKLMRSNRTKSMYSCEMCTYLTNHKGSLKIHLLSHKDTSEVIMYKCEICPHETKYKYSLKRHLLTHKSFSDVTVYECAMCTHRTKNKGSLKTHILTHRCTSEVTVYKCEMCTYQSKYKDALNRHMMTHKSASEITMWKCELCKFQTRQKRSLQRHLPTHNSTLAISVYNCELCAYTTKYEGNLMKHMLIHSDRTVYKCEYCTFESKYIDGLRCHMLTHNSTLEITTYKCENCAFQTTYENRLNRHLLSHKNKPKIMYNCEMCEYRSKFKGNLTRHKRTHERLRPK